MTLEACARCRRPTPPNRDSHTEWEIVAQADGLFAWVCPGCVTLEERKILDASVALRVLGD